jgi:hypothetical protein
MLKSDHSVAESELLKRCNQAISSTKRQKKYTVLAGVGCGKGQVGGMSVYFSGSKEGGSVGGACSGILGS